MQQKTVIITGANSGIGRAAAEQITARGHRVILACRNKERAGAVQREIGKGCSAGQLDLSRRRSIHEFTDWVHREIGAVDVLINNAADFDLSAPAREMTPDGFEKIWFTNHLAPVLLTDRLLDLLVQSPQGRIINISSKGLLFHPFLTVSLKDPMFGKRPFSVQTAYYQSKRAQTMYTQWLARQLAGTMVTANCIRVTNVRLGSSRLQEIPLWMKRIYALKARFSISPDRMAETYTRMALDEAAENLNGRQIEFPFREVSFSAYEKDLLCIEQVMQLTYRQLGMEPAISYQRPD